MGVGGSRAVGCWCWLLAWGVLVVQPPAQCRHLEDPAQFVRSSAWQPTAVLLDLWNAATGRAEATLSTRVALEENWPSGLPQRSWAGKVTSEREKNAPLSMTPSRLQSHPAELFRTCSGGVRVGYESNEATCWETMDEPLCLYRIWPCINEASSLLVQE